MTTIGHFCNGELLTDDTRPKEGANPATGKAEKTVSLTSKKTIKKCNKLRTRSFSSVA